MKYPCGQCHYQAAMNRLHQHRRSVHDGIKYPCGQCNYQSVTNTSMHLHRRSAHEGIKYVSNVSIKQCQKVT